MLMSMAQLQVYLLASFLWRFLPGIVLSISYIIYISILCLLKPHLAPSVPLEERQGSFWEKTFLVVKAALQQLYLFYLCLGLFISEYHLPKAHSGGHICYFTNCA